jgi:hypothetical protein
MTFISPLFIAPAGVVGNPSGQRITRRKTALAGRVLFTEAELIHLRCINAIEPIWCRHIGAEHRL